MLKRLVSLAAVIALLLSGCAYGADDEGLRAPVYRLRDTQQSGGALYQAEDVLYTAQEDILQVMVEALNSESPRVELKRVFPEGVKLLDCSIEKGVANLEMSQSYAELDGMQQLVCAGAAVLTLSALDSICSVNIICGGHVYYRGLTVEDIQQADCLFEDYRRTVKIYLPSPEYKGISPRSATVLLNGETPIEQLITEQILEGLPVSTDPTRVLSAKCEDGLCTVDLSEEFYGNEPADYVSGMLTVYSIVNSLCRLSAVDGVVIKVEGQNVASYGGFRPSWPMAANEAIVIY